MLTVRLLNEWHALKTGAPHFDFNAYALLIYWTQSTIDLSAQLRWELVVLMLDCWTGRKVPK